MLRNFMRRLRSPLKRTAVSSLTAVSNITGCYFNGSYRFAGIRRMEAFVVVNEINVDGRINLSRSLINHHSRLSNVSFHSSVGQRDDNSRRLNAILPEMFDETNL